MPNNATRRKANALHLILGAKTPTHVNYNQLRRAAAIEGYNPMINRTRNSKPKNASKGRANNGSKGHGSKGRANNGPMTWVTYEGKYQKMTLKKAKELGLKK